MLESDLQYLERAFDLAWSGLGVNSPNPMVGCVIVKEELVVGEGAHVYEKVSHAETAALEVAGENARDATLYVSLEPCNHTGRTGPCTEAIISAGISRVVYGISDPNPDVKGEGAMHLASAGVRVEKCDHVSTIKRIEDQNRFFLTGIRESRPWVTCKAASSLDGKIASRDGDSMWITGLEARSVVHLLRGIYDAILIGRQTAIKDDPQLTYRPGEHDAIGMPDILFPCRPCDMQSPVRIVIDPSLTLPRELRIFNTENAKTVVLATEDAPVEEGQRLSVQGVDIIRTGTKAAGIDLPRALKELASRGIQSLIVEGGGETLGRFFVAGLVDEVNFFLAPIIIGGKDAVSSVSGAGFASISDCPQLVDVKTCFVGKDMLIAGRVRRDL